MASFRIPCDLSRRLDFIVRQGGNRAIWHQDSQPTVLLEMPGRYGGFDDGLPSLDPDVDLTARAQAEFVTNRLRQHQAPCPVDGRLHGT